LQFVQPLTSRGSIAAYVSVRDELGPRELLIDKPAVSFAAALTGRLYNYINSGVIGGIGLAREGQTLSGVYQQLMNLRNKPKEGSVE
jgi:hypothetical protein